MLNRKSRAPTSDRNVNVLVLLPPPPSPLPDYCCIPPDRVKSALRFVTIYEVIIIHRDPPNCHNIVINIKTRNGIKRIAIAVTEENFHQTPGASGLGLMWHPLPLPSQARLVSLFRCSSNRIHQTTEMSSRSPTAFRVNR